MTCRVLSIGRHPQRKVKKQPDWDDKDGSGFETVMEAVPVHCDELKEFLVKHFTVEGRRPTIITYGVFNTQAEPAMSKGDPTVPDFSAPVPWQDLQDVGSAQ
eukprot:1634694-Rhodomonas_salina.1